MRSYLYIIGIIGAFLLVIGGLVHVSRGQEPGDGSNSGDSGIRYAHFAPFDQEGSNIFVTMNGVVVVNNFQFGFVTPVINTSAGEYQIEVYDSKSNKLLNQKSLILEPDKKYSLFFVGDIANKPFEIVFLEDATTPVEDKAIVRVAHFAQLVNGSSLSQIDLRLNNDDILQDDFAYGFVDNDYSIELDPGEIDTKITSTNGKATLFDVDPISMEAGDIYTYLFVGDTTNEAVRVYAYKNDEAGGFIPGEGDSKYRHPQFHLRIWVCLNNPNQDPDVAIEVLIDGAEFITETVFGQYNGPQPINPGTYDVQVYAKDNEELILTDIIDINVGEDYFLVLSGDRQVSNYSLFAEKVNTYSSNPDGPIIRIGHYSTFSDLEIQLLMSCFQPGKI